MLLTSVVSQVNKKASYAGGLELLYSCQSVRLELEEVAFKRTNKHLAMTCMSIAGRQRTTDDYLPRPSYCQVG